MEKIVITGALGYIGVGLCESYYRDKNTKVVALDNRFTSERVADLRRNGIDFVCGDILNESVMQEILKDADVVYHLAGITDVAYTKFESNEGKDLEIRQNGIQGTLNVLRNVPKHCKVIFPSTHVVYEGVEETTLNIQEDRPTKTLLTYATQKAVSEGDIRSSGINHIILRLGSVYGHVSDTTRMNIMPQLFSKIASQNGQITLHGGDNNKSLVAVYDVVRAMRFFAESDIKNETYHLTNENMTIREVAAICKKYNPKVTIVDGQAQTYSPSYTLSNQKLLETGFRFQSNIDDCIRSMIYDWSDDEGKAYIAGFIFTDRAAYSSFNLQPVISLGMSPLANNLLDSAHQPYKTYPLELMFCPDSYNCQLSYVVDPNEMFLNYLYVSSTSGSFREHFRMAADKYIEDFNLDSGSFVVDIGSNDGVALRPFISKGIKALGVEPSKNVSAIATKNGVNTVCKYFDMKTALDIRSLYGSADLVLASNVFAHSDGLSDMARAAFALLKDDGVFIVEVQYILDTIKDLTFDNIYHEHVNYWSVHSLCSFFGNNHLSLFKVEHVDTHGGSIRVYVRNAGYGNVDPSVKEFLSAESDAGLTEYGTYLKFSDQVMESKKNVRTNLDIIKKSKSIIAGYGAPAKATTMLNYYGINSDDIRFIVDDNPMKHGKFIPGTGIPVKPKVEMEKNAPDVVIVFAWNFFNEIRDSNSEIIRNGVRFVSIKDLQKPDFKL